MNVNTTALRADGIVWLRRLPVRYASILEFHAAYDQFLTIVDGWLFERRVALGYVGTTKQTPLAWLYDMRSAPSYRNDDAFEHAVVARHADLAQRSPVAAVLVQTAGGGMQVNRMSRTTKHDVSAFTDFDEAVHWLRGRLHASDG